MNTFNSAIHWINRYEVNEYKGNQLGYPLDRDLSSVLHYPRFKQLRPGVYFRREHETLNLSTELVENLKWPTRKEVQKLPF